MDKAKNNKNKVIVKPLKYKSNRATIAIKAKNKMILAIQMLMRQASILSNKYYLMNKKNNKNQNIAQKKCKTKMTIIQNRNAVSKKEGSRLYRNKGPVRLTKAVHSKYN